MAMTVEDMSRYSAYIMAGKTTDDVLKDFTVKPQDEKDVKRYCDGFTAEFAAIKPGDQMMVANEWS